jgi:hypothetical protein
MENMLKRLCVVAFHHCDKIPEKKTTYRQED